jgi:iron complex outermembrane recepter protein
MHPALHTAPLTRLHPLAAAAALALAAIAPAVWAQDQPAEANEAGKLQTITVTAERRTENILNVPQSVSAIRGEELEVLNSGGQDVRQLAARTPSLNIESSYGRAFPRFYVRGLGNTDFDLNASQPVSLVFDEVVQENPVLKGFPLFDLAQVEVLRGPQGTLFGRNSPAGVVKFESVKPSKKQDGYLSGSYGTYGTANLSTAFNLPLGGDWAARFSAQVQHRDDWVENTYDAGPTQKLEGYDDSAARIQVLYQPHADFSALANLHGREMKGSARLFRANIIKPGTNDLVDGFDPEKIATDGKNEQKLSSQGANLRLRWGLGGNMTLHSITGYETLDAYSRGDIDGGAPPYVFAGGPGSIPFAAESADGMPEHRQVTQEFRLEGDVGNGLKWLGGVYYFKEHLEIDSFNYDGSGGAQNGYATQAQDNTAWAVFGSLNYRFSDAFEMRGGLRYTRDTKDFVANRLEAPPFSAPELPRITRETRASNTSWDLSGTYTIDKDTRAYARIATGFRAPSIQGRLLFPPTGPDVVPERDWVTVADAEKVLSYEAGVKAELFDRRARLSASVFRYTVKDQQVTAVGGNQNFNRLINIDRTIGQGVELDLRAMLSDNLMVTVGASYNDTKIDDPDLAIAPCGNAQNLTRPNCTVTDPTNASDQALIDGNPLPQAPKTVLNFTARYGLPTESGGEWFVFTDWAYRSQINFFLYESKEYTGKPLLEGGLRMGYSWANGKYEAAVFGRNITNETVAVGGIDFNNLTGFINDPRTWGASFRMSF